MNRNYLRILWLLVWCLTTIIHGEGFVADTHVHTPRGQVALQDLAVGDAVTVYDWSYGINVGDDPVIVEVITDISVHVVDTIIQLDFDDETIELASNQLLFVPLQMHWAPACTITPGTYLLGAPLRAVQVKAVTHKEYQTRTYALSLAHHHTYLVGKHALVVHNCGEYALIGTQAGAGLTFLNAFLAANPLVAPVTIAVGGAGLVGYLVWNTIREIKESRKVQREKRRNTGNGQPEEPKKPQESHSIGAEAVALLKAIDESKDKAVEVFNKTCEYLVSEAGVSRVAHAFRANCEHNFGPLLAKMGVDINSKTDLGKKQVIEAGTKILMDISKKLIDMGSKLPIDAQGLFQNIVVEYGQELITVRGCIHEGVFKIGTMFIQPQHFRKLV